MVVGYHHFRKTPSEFKKSTLPKTNSKFTPEKRPSFQKETIQSYSNHPCSGAKLLVSGRVLSSVWLQIAWVNVIIFHRTEGQILFGRFPFIFTTGNPLIFFPPVTSLFLKDPGKQTLLIFDPRCEIGTKKRHIWVFP